VTSRDEQIALIRAILDVSTAVLNVREMVFAVKDHDEKLFIESFNKSTDAISKVHDQLSVLIEALGKDG
jgi:hypothetical protein